MLVLAIGVATRCAVVWQGNPNRPFCSLSCRLIDLGVWLDERYRIAGEPIPTDPSPEDRVPAGSG
ncbi:MAG: DNA gyrase inhibitor YacG [candidate division NC10 bacterium]